MKNEVRPIDANALEQKIREYMNYYQNTTDILTACRAVLSMLGDEGQTPTLTGHFHDFSKMTPLTLEQLRGMGGKPYWHVGLRKENADPHWKILDPFIARYPEDYGYGKRWLAYAYQPAHIDREAWGCEYCTGDVDDRPFLDSEDLYISGDGRLTSDGRDHDFCKIEFCPKCGRPLTEEAWAELEKRVRG